MLRCVSYALRGEVAEAAKGSFDCIMCGLCFAKCPAEVPPYYIELLCRRLYGRYGVPPAQHLAGRVAEIEAGKFDAELGELKSMGANELRRRYRKLKVEP